MTRVKRATRIRVVTVLSILAIALTAPAFAEDGKAAPESEDQRIEAVRTHTPLYTKPEDGSPIKMRIKKGKKIVTKGAAIDGYYQVATKSGTTLYIREADVRVLGPKSQAEDDLISGEDAPARAARLPASQDPDEKWRLTFDLGLSMGSIDDKNYTEADLGLNLFFNRYVSLRNAVFGRFGSDLKTAYGLDSSIRGFLRGDLGAVGDVMAFAGPGYRFINVGKDVPFAEAGVVFRLAGISLGGGVKHFFMKMVDSTAVDHNQYFIILSGGGSL